MMPKNFILKGITVSKSATDYGILICLFVLIAALITAIAASIVSVCQHIKANYYARKLQKIRRGEL